MTEKAFTDCADYGEGEMEKQNETGSFYTMRYSSYTDGPFLWRTIVPHLTRH